MNLAPQTWTFLLSCLLGVFLGVCYDVFRILRVAIPPSKTSLFLQDLLFVALVCIGTFLFLQSITDGSLRLFVLVGEFLGFVLYHFTVGVWVLKAAAIIIAYIKRALRFIWRIALLPFIKAAKWLGKKLSPLLQKIIHLGTRGKNFLKKGLLFFPHLLYNSSNKTKRKRKKHGKNKKNQKG